MGRPPGLLHARQLRSANAERARDGVRRSAPVSPLLPSTSASVRQVLARDCQKGFSGDSWPSSCHDRGADLGLQDSAKDQAAVRQSQDVPTACGESYLWPRLAHRSKVAPSCSEPAGLAGMVRAAGLDGDAGAPP